MNSVKKKLPIGIENFAKLQAEDFYYVDKTMLIKELLDNWAEMNRLHVREDLVKH